MWREPNLAGVYLPPLLAYLVAAFVVYLPFRFVLTRLGVWRWVWNQPLVEVGLFVSVLAVLSELL